MARPARPVRNAAGHISRVQDYDAFGHPLTAIDPNGVVTTATYDPLGRPLTSTIAAVPGCNTAADPLCATHLTTTRTYSSTGGPLATEARPAANVTTYAYDSRGRLTSLTRGTAATALERMDYTYDPTTGKKASEILSAFQANAWVVTKSETYTYTSDGNLSSAVHSDGTKLVYAYLPDGTLASTQDENHATPNSVYAYDGLNRPHTGASAGACSAPRPRRAPGPSTRRRPATTATATAVPSATPTASPRITPSTSMTGRTRSRRVPRASSHP